MSDSLPISFTRPCAMADGAPCAFVSRGRFDDKSGRVGPVRVVQCSRCGLGVSMPPIPDVTFLYAGRESQDFQPDTRGLAHRIKEWLFRRQAVKLIEQLGHVPATLLDFGCGSGQFTRCLADTIPACQVTGADFHDSPPTELSRRSYFAMVDHETHVGQFDVVIAMHVLEHDDDSDSLLRRIAATVKKGGLVVIEVPNIDCVWARLIGRHWDAWYLPFHRMHFSREALKSAIERAGLSIVRETGACVPTMGRSMANIAGARNNLFFLLMGAALHPIQWLGEKLSGQPSAIRIISRFD